MRLKTIAFFIVAIIFTSDISFAQSAYCVPTRNLTENNYPFKAGESLTMIFHYRWGVINADLGKGSVLLDTSVLNGIPVFHCKAYGHTYKFYDNFFEVSENFQSWFTKDGLVPMRFTRNTHEGDYICRNDFSYKWTPGNEHIDANLYTLKKGARTVTLPLSKCVFDLPALFYMARNMDLSKVVRDVKYPMTFVIDDDVYNVYFIFRGKEVKNVYGLGDVHTLKFSAQLLKGEVFKGDGDMTLWITDDDNRIPVYIEASNQGRIHICQSNRIFGSEISVQIACEMKEISHIGKIVEVNPQFTTVEIISQSACSACHASGLCGMSEYTKKAIQVTTDPYQDYNVGDEVEVLLRQSMGVKAVWISYAIPLIILMILVLSLSLFLKNELLVGLIAIAGVALYYLGVYLFRDKLAKEYVFYIKAK